MTGGDGAGPATGGRLLEVLVISHPSTVWGAQLRLMETAPHLLERGIRLVLATSEESRLSTDWVGRGLPSVPLDLPVHRPLRHDDGTRVGPPAMAREALTVARAASRIARISRSYDMLLSFSISAHVETALAGRLARRPVVVELVDFVVPGVGRRLLALAGRLASLVVVNSAATGTMLSDGAHVQVIHPGVDLERFAPGPHDPAVRASLGGVPGAPLIGIVGRIDPGKGVEVLVEAMKLLRSRDARLVIVGDVGVGPPELLRDIRRSAAELGDRVCFAGRRSDVPEVVRSLDVLVNASVAEPFGRSVLEAQASGVPVVATAAGGIPEFVQHEVTGVLVQPDHPSDLADALDRVLGDEALREELRGNARRQAEERFGTEGRYDLIASTYRRLLERNR